jgi:choice-of-anchor C domain-containing protein
MPRIILAAGLACALAASSGLAQEPRPARAAKSLLIVAPSRFHGILQPYANFKNQHLPTLLVSLEDVLRTTAGRDDPERLKHYLHDRWRHLGLGYVLLVGDVDVMPTRFMTVDRNTTAAFDYTFHASDLYYADLAKPDGGFDDWNGHKDGFHALYYGEVRGEHNKQDPINYDRIDYRPEIAVGRWPVDNAREVRLLVEKSSDFERRIRLGTHPGLRRLSLFHVGGFTDDRARFDDQLRRMPRGWSGDRFYFSDENRKSDTPPPDSAHFIEALHRGSELAWHIGHGDDDDWVDCFNWHDLPKLHNEDRTAMMFSCGCGTAAFSPQPPYDGYTDYRGRDHIGTNHGEVFKSPPPPPAPYQRGKHNPTCLGEQVLKHDRGGAVIYIGCNVGSQGCGVSLMEGYLRSLRASPNALAGDHWVRAVSFYYDHEHLAELKPDDGWYPPAIFAQAMKFMFFGDPSLPLAPPSPNLLVNNTFEDGPDVPGEYRPVQPGSTEVVGWRVTRGQIDIINSPSAADGLRFIDLHGSPGYGGIAQTFRSKRGQRYRVSFSLAGPQDAEVPVKRMVVAAAGQSREFSCDSTGHSREDMGWDVKRWEFTATSDQTTLEFRTLEDKDPYHGPCLDDVSVSAVPGGKTVPAKETKSSAGNGWVDLFNCKDLSGWKMHPISQAIGRWRTVRSSAAAARRATCSASAGTMRTSTCEWRPRSTPGATAGCTSAASTGSTSSPAGIPRATRPRSSLAGAAINSSPAACTASRRSRTSWSMPTSGSRWR